jgi:hypothetical protein
LAGVFFCCFYEFYWYLSAGKFCFQYCQSCCLLAASFCFLSAASFFSL